MVFSRGSRLIRAVGRVFMLVLSEGRLAGERNQAGEAFQGVDVPDEGKEHGALKGAVLHRVL
jgi:hypothetical protein